jgi:ketosteroid isomerase-like protein
MADILIANLDQDGERRPFAAHGHATLANAGAVAVLRGVFEPGWRWSNDVAPLAGTATCHVHHQGFVLSGSMRVRLQDGTERDLVAGDLFDLPPGHDAWVTSDVPCEMFDVSPQATGYAVGRPSDIAEPEDKYMKLVRRGYEAFNAGDLEGIRALVAHDVAEHVPGTGPFAGTHKGVDAVLDYYRRLAELTEGTYRADLVEVQGDGSGHVIAIHQQSAVRNGVKHVSRGSLLFTFIGDKVTDVQELGGDLPGFDAFLS